MTDLGYVPTIVIACLVLEAGVLVLLASRATLTRSPLKAVVFVPVALCVGLCLSSIVEASLSWILYRASWGGEGMGYLVVILNNSLFAVSSLSLLVGLLISVTAWIRKSILDRGKPGRSERLNRIVHVGWAVAAVSTGWLIGQLGVGFLMAPRGQ